MNMSEWTLVVFLSHRIILKFTLKTNFYLNFLLLKFSLKFNFNIFDSSHYITFMRCTPISSCDQKIERENNQFSSSTCFIKIHKVLFIFFHIHTGSHELIQFCWCTLLTYHTQHITTNFSSISLAHDWFSDHTMTWLFTQFSY